MSATFTMTVAERMERLRDMAPSFEVYWPGDQWFFQEYAGNPIWIPPDLGGKMVEHPVLRNDLGGPKMVIADGIFHARDVYGYKYSKRAVPINGNYQRKVESKNHLLFQAKEIVEFLLKRNEQRGMGFLTGDEGQDAVLKRECRQKYQSAYRGWAQGEIDARREFLDRFKKENPGVTTYPPPKKSQIRAEMLLNRMTADETAGSAAYVCECGMFEHDDRETFELHLQMRHGKKLEAPEVKAPEAEVDIDAIPPEQLVADPESFQAPKRGPGRPRKSV